MNFSNLVSQIKSFIFRHYIKLILIVVPLGVVLFLGSLIAYNQTKFFCYSCHINEGPYSFVDKSREVHKDLDQHLFSCIKCHKDKAVQTIYYRFLKRNKNYIEKAANLQTQNFIDPKATYQSEQCLICHADRLEIDEIPNYLLGSENLRRIGLRVNKKLHYRFEMFNTEDQIHLQQLAAKTERSQEEKEELDRLEKIKTSNCAPCHLMRKKAGEEAIIDKTVNFAARNPISCAGCHEDVDPISHPGKPLATPTEETCRKCHHGLIHGKFLIFKANCADLSQTENCVKCHPKFKISNSEID